MKREKVFSGGIYHVYNRGVDKRKVFINDDDSFRFIHDLFEFNDKNPVNNVFHRFQYKGVEHPYIEKNTFSKPRKLIVKILVFVLMPNHFHLLLQPLHNDGVVNFMKKIGGGYTNYFNQKYERSGALFEGRYKCVRVATDEHLLHLPYYIHANPLKLKSPKWKEGLAKKDFSKALKFLENYKWSSFPDYIGKKNFPSITNRELIWEFHGKGSEENLAKAYKKDFSKWLKDFDEFSFSEEIK